MAANGKIYYAYHAVVLVSNGKTTYTYPMGQNKLPIIIVVFVRSVLFIVSIERLTSILFKYFFLINFKILQLHLIINKQTKIKLNSAPPPSQPFEMCGTI